MLFNNLRLAIFFLCISVFLQGQSFFENNQPPRFGLIGRADGLGSLSISSIQQDKYGFLWFGSQGGLNRFDGKNLITYTHDPFDSNSIPNDLIQTLYYEKSKNYLWIGTYGGLSRLNIDTGQFLHYKKGNLDGEGLSNNIVITISRDSRGDLWVGTIEGLNRISNKDNKITYIKTLHPTIRSLYLDSSNRLWIGSYGGIQYWDDRSQRTIIPKVQLPSSNVMSIKESEPGRMLIGMWGGGIAEYWPDTNKIKPYSLPDNRIYTALETKDGTIWAGSWGGGLWAQPKKGKSVWFESTINSELANTIIYDLFEDKGGLLWVGTNGGGVHYLSPRRNNYRIAAHNPNNPNSISEGKISAILKGSDGGFYVGVDGGGLNIINQSTGKVTTLKHSPDRSGSISNDNINFIFEDKKENLWIATSNGLNLFNRRSQIFKTWSRDIKPDLPLSHTIISHLMEDKSGRLWIGTYGNGVDRYDPKVNKLVNFKSDSTDPGSLSDGSIYYILEKSDGSVWIATNDGLNRYKPEDDTFKHYLHLENDRNSISGNNTRCLYEDSQGRLWVGTYSAGLNYFNQHQDRFFHFTKRDGLSSNNVLAILEGNDNHIWISTRGGINIIDPRTNQIERIDERDGLFGVFFNSGSYKDEKGALYFGGSHGITKIKTIKKYSNLHKPDVHITKISVMGKPLKNKTLVFDGNEYTFPHNKNFLSFEFIALDYESPSHNQYLYKMEGFDKDWINNGSRSFATYTNLPPGKYRFIVKASNNDLLWNNKGASVHIQVLSPLYQRWWVYIIYIILFSGLIIMIWKFRESRLLEHKNKELEYTNNLLGLANLELELLSLNDNLTGLYNRRYFDSQLRKELMRAKRALYPLSILMIDVDNFKQFNDTYGHVAGDKALKVVSGALISATPRNTDFITRYGGEEFAIVLFNTELSGARNVADSIHKMMKKSEILLDKKELRLSLSIGICSEIPKEIDPEHFVHRADLALYKAKKNGRARTEVFEE